MMNPATIQFTPPQFNPTNFGMHCISFNQNLRNSNPRRIFTSSNLLCIALN